MAETESEKARHARAVAYNTAREWGRVPLRYRLAHRARTFQAAMMLSSGSLCDGDVGPVIVEAGTIRTPGNWEGDGQSTLVWARWVEKLEVGRVYSFDPDPAAIAAASRVLAGQEIKYAVFTSGREARCVLSDPMTRADLRVALVQAEAQGEDGVPSLEDEPINLLYLDAGDYVDGSLRTAAALNRDVFLAAREVLERSGPWATVLIDDVNLAGTVPGGKGHYVLDELALRGWHRYPFAPGFDYQAVATLGAPEVDPAAKWGVPLA